MNSDELTVLRAQLAAVTAATLAATAAAAQDNIEAEDARNLITADLAIANLLIAQLTTTRTTNTVPDPTFCLTPGQMSPDQILNYSSETDITIYKKSITPFKLTFDGAISNIKVFMDEIMQRANDTSWYKVQGDIIHVPGDGIPINFVTH